MAELRFFPPAAKYLKKLKDKRLKNLYREAIDRILEDPSVGIDKTGDLKGIKGYDIYYCGINYELAYKVEYIWNNEQNRIEVVVVIMAGTRENFYDQLKRYMRQ